MVLTVVAMPFLFLVKSFMDVCVCVRFMVGYGGIYLIPDLMYYVYICIGMRSKTNGAIRYLHG